MKRKTSVYPTRIYTYGCLPPTKNADLVETQFRLARVYKNKLIEIELARLERVRKAILTAPDVAAAKRRLDDLLAERAAADTAIRAARAAARSGVVDVSAMKAKLAALKPELKAAREALKSAKAVQKSEAITAEIDAADAAAAAAVRAARAASGLYWGTYLLVEQAAEQARKSKHDPKFRRWDGRGRIGVQIQTTRVEGTPTPGMPVAALATNAWMQIDPVPADAWSTRSNRRKLTRTRVRIRIGSDGRAPVFAEFPMILHRSLPADAVIKWAWIHRTRLALGFRYELQIVLEAPSFLALPKKGPAVAIDVGWRSRPAPHDLRIGYLVDENGRSEEILGPTSVRAGEARGIVSRLAHVDSLRVIQDRILNETKSALLAYLEQGTLPSDFVAELKDLALWRSSQRLADLIWKHRDTLLTYASMHPSAGPIVDRIDAWRVKWRHLYSWEAHVRDNISASRRDYYRRMAADIASRYGTVVLEAFDLRHTLSDSAAGAESDVSANQRYYQRAAAISEFRTALRSVCSSRGVTVVVVDPTNTTATCSRCGSLETVEAELLHRCSACGVAWDVDENAARNLLRLWASGSMAPVGVDPLEEQNHSGNHGESTGGAASVDADDTGARG